MWVRMQFPTDRRRDHDGVVEVFEQTRPPDMNQRGDDGSVTNDDHFSRNAANVRTSACKFSTA